MMIPDVPNNVTDPVLSDLARQILAKRYLIKGEDGEPIETPKEMLWRVAVTVADAEQEHKRAEYAILFYEMMASGRFLPNSPTLMNAGRPLGQLSACFVLPVADSIYNGEDGIYDTLKDMAIIHKSGGGTGFSFSSLRPGGATVRSTTGVASGPVSFMRLYDASTDVVKQGGTRRGANMGVLRVDHPDVLEFIDCKQNTAHITNFNISVAVTDEFMEAVLTDDAFDLKWEGKVYETVQARDIWDTICENAWATGEPGLFFIDEANRHNPVPHLGEYEATNPCGEQPLLPYDVCNLGSINLSKFIIPNSSAHMAEGKMLFDQHALDETIRTAVRFLDNVIDVNNYPLDQISDLSQRIRRIGLGVMGWADYLIKAEIAYSSEDAILEAGRMSKFIRDVAADESEALGRQKGMYEDGRQRNCNITTVAPTGTISIIAGCSGGIEPVFAFVMERNQAGIKHTESHPLYEKHLFAAPETIPAWFEEASDITPDQHVRMQAAWQKNIDSAISKTINMPERSSIEDVEDAYMLAYELDCKGVTVYRDGCRPMQVLSKVKPEVTSERVQPRDNDAAGAVRYERPEVLDGRTHSVDSPIGRMYVTVNRDDGEVPREVFVSVGKAGGTATSFSEAIGRLISLLLRRGIDIKEIHRQLRGISSDRAFGLGGGRVASGPDAVAKVLEKYLDAPVKVSNGADDFGSCPDCHADLSFEGGCYVCHACGYSGCG